MLVLSATFLGLAPLLATPVPLGQEPCEVVKVVDGDTIHVSIGGEVEKLRLLSVDTEEKISGNVRGTASKPETVFGHETALWARELIGGLAEPGKPAEVRLLFPEGRRERDAYGRLLCHVILPDGRDFNLLLVQLGKSPYFNKYGNSRVAHAEFVAAQAKARRQKLGIWNPATNRPRDPSAPMARRPYDRLLPWWEARACAIDGFWRTAASSAGRVISGECARELLSALETCLKDPEQRVEVFASIERFYEEDDGSLTVRFRDFDERRTTTCAWMPGDREKLGEEYDVHKELRASLPAAERGGELESMLRASTEEFRQNYLYVSGSITVGRRGMRIATDGPDAWRLAGPEPR